MSNSFNRDLFELTQEEFRSRYGGPKSREDFAMWRARACGSSHDRIIALTSEGISGASSDTWTWANASTYIVTRVFIKLVGDTEMTLTVTINSQVLELSKNFDQIDLTGLEEEITEIDWTSSAHNGVAHLMVFGYTPPA